MQVAPDTFVSFHYSVHNQEGSLVDSSEGRDPLGYVHGHGRIIPGLERVLEGRVAGDDLNISVPPEDAYGSHDPALDVAIPRDAFPEEMQDQLSAGLRFRAEHPQQEGQSAIFTIHEVEDARVLASANHPLAGQTLTFQINIVEVRKATAEEIQPASACSSCNGEDCGEGGCGEEGCGEEGCGH